MRPWLSSLATSERPSQRKLDQPGRAGGLRNSAKGTGILDICLGGIGEIRVIPDVEEIGRESKRLPLGDPEVLDEREVPVLLKRSVINIPPKISEISGAEAGVGNDGSVALVRVAQVWPVQQRGGGKVRGVQITIQTLVNIALA